MLIAMVTVKAGKEGKVARDLMDALFPYDQKVKVSGTDFSGILLLETSLEPDELLKLMERKPIAHLYKVRPFLHYSSFDEEGLRKALLQILSRLNVEWKKFLVRVRVRGNKDVKEGELAIKLAKSIEEELRKKGDLKKPEIIVKVDVIGKHVGVSIYKGNTFIHISGYRERSIEKV